ncbi:hypothetical protein ETB97_004964 [Aspergillus alliaceus]|uniref:Uncharacterized protein n=1 Tax=Petromyces alliaceus TaxID=209559 RepID=A0A8H6E3C6_PETAA|nr:hypothetical protein ETB97_004964 [Aspergillus burnettii]
MDYPTSPIIFGLLIIAIFTYILSGPSAPSSVPRNLPWLTEGYEKVVPSTSSQYCTVAKLYWGTSMSIPWFLEHPDSVLSVSEWHREVLMGEYNFTHNHILKDPYHEHVIHRSLNRNLQPVVMDIWDELGRAFDGTWGMESTTWEEIPLMENLMFIDSRVSKRMFERLGHIQRKRNNPSYDWKEPNDYVSWRINLAMAVDNKVEIDPVMISRRLMPLNFAAIHTATISISNTFLDVLSTDGSKGIVDGLKEEVERVYAD